MQDREQPPVPPVPVTPPVGMGQQRPQSHWNPQATRLVVAIVASMFAIAMMFAFLSGPRSHTSVQILSNVVMLFAFGTVFLLILTLMIILGVTRRNARRVQVVQPWTFDMAVFKRYQDCLNAVSIGAGQEAPSLVVTNMPSPLAYIDFQPLTTLRPFQFAASTARPVRKVIAVTNSLLAADFTYQEIESIVAVLLGKWVLDAADQTSPGFYSGFYDQWVKELGLNDYIVGITRAEFLDDRICLDSLLADAYAARLTHHPESLKSAIKKSDALLAQNPIRPRAVEPRKMFVEPSGQGRFSDGPAWLINAQYRSTGPKRDRIIQLRLENLDIIKQGMRNPHEEVRDGIPVTGPKGWE